MEIFEALLQEEMLVSSFSHADLYGSYSIIWLRDSVGIVVVRAVITA